MNESPTVNVEAFLIRLICDSIFDFGAKHHLIATHKIKHDVFKFGLKSYWVNQVEIYDVIGGDLDSFVSFDEVNESTDLQLVVLFPQFDGGIILVLKYFEK